MTFARHAPCPGPIAQEKPCESAIPEGSRSEFRTLIGAGPRLYELPRIPIPRTRVNKNAKGYYEPLHSTLSSTFCPSGTKYSNSLAGLITEMVTVSPSTSKKVTRAFSSSGTKTSILS